MSLPPRSAEILAFIASFQNEQGAPPTVREIGERFGIRSTNGVAYHLELLEREGLIQKRRGRARGICLSAEGESESALGLPILGRIAAGDLVGAQEILEGRLDAERMLGGQASFALRVQGDSMRDAGILDGDLVIVARTTEARNGEIVVAMAGDEATVKRFFRRKGEIILQPENPAYEPIRLTERSPEVRIVGRVIGVYRDLA